MKSGVGPLRIDENGKKTDIVSEIKIATELNQYFASAFQKVDDTSPLPVTERLNCRMSFVEVIFDELKVKRAIESL